jgi:HEAT repeat protein
MIRLLLPLTLALAAAEPATPRKPSAIAPSLPALTKEEEAKLDDLIDRFMLADTGRLRGAEARKATEAFEKLGPEAIPALIRGINKAARIKHSCPTLMISRKLNKLLMASEDPVLLEFARDEIGADGSLRRSPHAGTLQDLRVRCMLRRNALARRPAPPPRGPSAMTTPELARAASTQRGERLQGILRELGKRDGKEALAGLTVAAGSYDKDTQKLGRELLDANLGRQSMSFVKEKLEDDSAEVRRSAVRVAAGKHVELVPAIIGRLTDADAGVRGEARQALVKLSKGEEDFGPAAGASAAQQREAQKRWQAWWDRRTAEK